MAKERQQAGAPKNLFSRYLARCFMRRFTEQAQSPDPPGGPSGIAFQKQNDNVSGLVGEMTVPNRRFFLTLSATLFIAGCVSVASESPMNLSERQVVEIQESVKRGMIDPSSTVFQNIRGYDAVLTDGKTYQYVCGDVNSKNRMGGYTGFTNFKGRYEGSRFILEYVDQPGETRAYYACKR